MRKSVWKNLGFLLAISLSACSSVVEPVQIPGLSTNSKLQENFDIELSPLTFTTAQELNQQNYDRLVSRPGRGFSADVVSESKLINSKFPLSIKPSTYQLGIGDEITLIQYVDLGPSVGLMDGVVDLSQRDLLNPQKSIANTSSVSVISTKSRIGTDGSILLIGVGRIQAEGQAITSLRDEVRSILIRTGKAPNFQLEISAFSSKKAYLTINSAISKPASSENFVIPITDQVKTLREIVAGAGITFNQKVLTLIKIQRSSTTYSFPLSELFSETAPDVYLQDKDHVFVETLTYLPGKVFLVGGVEAKIIPILPENRESLAEVLFAPNGPMQTSSAQRSAVYLLRGNNPIRAYHLDAQNPARILVADKVELRPDDIVFVAEQPINTFNRVLGTILPLRILSRDIQNDRIP